MNRYVAIVLLRVVVKPVHRDACVKRARHGKCVFIESNMGVVLPVAFVERTSGCADPHVVCGAGLRDAAEVFGAHAVSAAVELRLGKRLLGVFDALLHEFFVVEYRRARAAEGRRGCAAVGLCDSACDFSRTAVMCVSSCEPC